MSQALVQGSGSVGANNGFRKKPVRPSKPATRETSIIVDVKRLVNRTSSSGRFKELGDTGSHFRLIVRNEYTHSNRHRPNAAIACMWAPHAFAFGAAKEPRIAILRKHHLACRFPNSQVVRFSLAKIRDRKQRRSIRIIHEHTAAIAVDFISIDAPKLWMIEYCVFMNSLIDFTRKRLTLIGKRIVAASLAKNLRGLGERVRRKDIARHVERKHTGIVRRTEACCDQTAWPDGRESRSVTK